MQSAYLSPIIQVFLLASNFLLILKRNSWPTSLFLDYGWIRQLDQSLKEVWVNSHDSVIDFSRETKGCRLSKMSQYLLGYLNPEFGYYKCSKRYQENELFQSQFQKEPKVTLQIPLNCTYSMGLEK